MNRITSYDAREWWDRICADCGDEEAGTAVAQRVVIPSPLLGERTIENDDVDLIPHDDDPFSSYASKILLGLLGFIFLGFVGLVACQAVSIWCEKWRAVP